MATSDNFIPKGLSSKATSLLKLGGYQYSVASGAWIRPADNFRGYEGEKLFLPSHQPNSIFEMGRISRSGHGLLYKNREMNLTQYASAKMSEIAKLSSLSKTEKLQRLDTFAKEFTAELRSMPPASVTGFGGSEANASSFKDPVLARLLRDPSAPETKVSARLHELANKGYYFLPGKVEKGIISRMSPSALMPGMGGIHALNKYTTLTNVLPVYGTTRSVTPFAVTRETITAANRAYHPAYRTLHTGLSLRALFVDPASAHTVGTGAIFRASALRGHGAIRPMEITFSKKLLGDILGKEEATDLLGKLKRAPAGLQGVTVSRGILRTLQKARSDQDELRSLLGTVEPNQVDRLMSAHGIKLGRGEHKLFGLKKMKGGQYTFFGGEVQPIALSTKMVIAGQKTSVVGAWHDTPFDELAAKAYPHLSPEQIAGVDVIMSHAGTSKLDQRETANLFFSKAQDYIEGAQHPLERTRRTSEVLNIINADIKRGPLATVGASGVLELPGSWKAIPSNIKAIEAKLQSAGIFEDALEALRAPNISKLPDAIRRVHAQPLLSGLTSTFRSTGRTLKVGIDDVAAAMAAKRPRLASEFAKSIAQQPAAQQLMEGTRVLYGSLPKTLKVLDTTTIKAMANITRVRGGGLGNITTALPLNPETSAGYVLNLPRPVSVTTGQGRIVNMTNAVFEMGEATGLAWQEPGMSIRATPYHKSWIKLAKAIVGNDSRVSLEQAAQEYWTARENLLGKDRLFTRKAFKAQMTGIRGAASFLSPEEEQILNRVYNKGKPSATGWLALTRNKAEYLLANDLQGLTDPTERLAKLRSLMSEGVYTYAGRPPQYPSGYAPVRLALLEELGQFNDYATKNNRKASENIMRMSGIVEGYSPIPGKKIAADADIDIVVAHRLSEATRAEAKREHYRLYRTSQFGDIVGTSLTASERAMQLEAAGSALNAELIGEASIAKGKVTGPLHNLALQMQDYGRRYVEQRKQWKTMGILNPKSTKHWTPEYVESLAYMAGRGAETGFDYKKIKQEEALKKAVRIRPATLLRKSNLTPQETTQLIDFFGLTGTKHAYRTIRDMRMLAHDVVNSGRAGQNYVEMMQKANSAFEKPAMETAQKLAFMRGVRSKGAPVTPMQLLAKHGLFPEAGDVLGQMNAATASGEGGIKGIKEVKGMIGEGLNKFIGELKAGRGWGTVALGAIGVAGLVASFRKPGVMIARPDQNPVDQRAYYNEGDRAEIIPQRYSTNVRTMTNQQHNVRIRVRDSQKRDRGHYINMAESFASNTGLPTSSRVTFSDNSATTDYGRIFQNEASMQLA
jgi:hypothetical protein